MSNLKRTKFRPTGTWVPGVLGPVFPHLSRFDGSFYFCVFFREEKLQHSFCRFSREPLFQDEMGTNELCSFSLEEIILRSRGGPPNLNYLTLLCYFLTLPPWGSLQLFCLTEWEDKGLIPVNLAWIPGQLKKCHWLDLRCWGENGQSQRWTTKWHLVLMPTWHGQWWFLT